MPIINTINWWNARIAPPIGLLTNFWFLWLVLYRTPKEMRAHSRILLQTCVLDIIFLTISLIGMPVFKKNHSKIIWYYWQIFLQINDIGLYAYDGLLFTKINDIFGDGIIMAHSHIYFYYFYFIWMSIGIQFIYRYLLLNR